MSEITKYAEEVVNQLNLLTAKNLEKYPAINKCKHDYITIAEHFVGNMEFLTSSDRTKLGLLEQIQSAINKRAVEALFEQTILLIKEYVIISSYYPENDSVEIKDNLINLSKSINVVIKHLNIHFDIEDDYLSLYQTSIPTGSRVNG